MEVQYVDSFNEYGCYWQGNLAVIDYWAEAERIRSTQLLEGFGQGACLTALDIAKQTMESTHPEGFTVLLGIPKLVVRLK